MKLSKKQGLGLGAIALCVVLLLTIILAPARDGRGSGSSYSRTPDGYGAWYQYMTQDYIPSHPNQQIITLKRWQKPFSEQAKPTEILPGTNQTLLRIYSNLTDDFVNHSFREWVNRGNTLILLGVKARATPAPFALVHESSWGPVKIETSRRTQKPDQDVILKDTFGAMIWREQVGKGQIIYAVTPYLGANAYQDYPSNYQLLAHLATQSHREKAQVIEIQNNPVARTIWIDEYIHGYKDKEVIQEAQEETLWRYFAKTPVVPAILQGLIIFGLVIIALNRRFGQPKGIQVKSVNNSQAYIEALARVLEKAGSQEFVVEVLGKEEQLKLQKELGLNTQILKPEVIKEAWQQRMNQSSPILEDLLQLSTQLKDVKYQNSKRKKSELELKIWYEKWRTLQKELFKQ